jgi:hypothetical protein
MTPKLASQIGLVLLLSAIAVLAFSVYRSSHGMASQGLSALGTVLVVVGIGIRMQARRR